MLSARTRNDQHNEPPTLLARRIHILQHLQPFLLAQKPIPRICLARLLGRRLLPVLSEVPIHVRVHLALALCGFDEAKTALVALECEVFVEMLFSVRMATDKRVCKMSRLYRHFNVM